MLTSTQEQEARIALNTSYFGAAVEDWLQSGTVLQQQMQQQSTAWCKAGQPM
jgi:hypothetical protein